MGNFIDKYTQIDDVLRVIEQHGANQLRLSEQNNRIMKAIVTSLSELVGVNIDVDTGVDTIPALINENAYETLPKFFHDNDRQTYYRLDKIHYYEKTYTATTTTTSATTEDIVSSQAVSTFISSVLGLTETFDLMWIKDIRVKGTPSITFSGQRVGFYKNLTRYARLMLFTDPKSYPQRHKNAVYTMLDNIRVALDTNDITDIAEYSAEIYLYTKITADAMRKYLKNTF